MSAEWYQQSLTPPEVIEVRLRLGVVPERDHVQALVELIDPMTGIQIAQWSAPHVPVDRWMDLLEEAAAKARQQLGDALEPF